MTSMTYLPPDQHIARPEGLWLRWTRATALGELVGFAIPAVAGAIAGSLGLAQSALVVVLVCAGTLEGAVLGLAQWLVLHRYLTAVRRRDWVVATALAAALAWSIGLIPSSIEAIAKLSPALLAIGGVVLGSLFLLSIGGAQWWVLRRHVPHAGWWVAANAVAWPLGVAVPVIALSLAPDGAPPVVLIAIGIASGIVMGLVVGAITGLVLTRLVTLRLNEREHQRPSRR